MFLVLQTFLTKLDEEHHRKIEKWTAWVKKINDRLFLGDAVSAQLSEQEVRHQ